MHESTIIISCPNGIRVYLPIIMAITSVPPLEARALKIKPTPIPISNPPKIDARRSSPSISGLYSDKYPKISTKAAVKTNPTIVLVPKRGPKSLVPIIPKEC